MGVVATRSAGRRFRRARRLRKDRGGVVAVIGTLLALLVFFALFGVFLTQYLPLWMTDNESQYTAQAQLSFALFKSNVDSQYQFPGAAPQTLATPFQMSSDGIPLLANPTQGTLVFLPTSCPGGFVTPSVTGTLGQPVNPANCVFQNVSLSHGPGGGPYYTQRVASGVLEMILPNRYFTPETFYFENDGVVQYQSGTYQTMTINPPLNVTRHGTNTTVTLSFLQLYGNASTFIGQGSQDVYSHYRYSQFVSANGVYVSANNSYLPYVFTYEVGTLYPCAWESFLKTMMGVSNVTASSWSLTGYSGSCANPNAITTDLTLTISNVRYTSFYYAGNQISLGIGGT